MALDDINEARLRLRTGQKWSLYPPAVLPAWVADMDFAVAEPIRAALAARIENGDLGYPLPVARSGIAELFVERVAARFGWHIDASAVVILNDVVQGLYLGLETLSAPGDGVIIQTPIYPPFLQAVAELGRRAVQCPLHAGSTRYEIDFEQLEAAIDGGTRVLMLCNPHNPTGRAFTRDELARLAAFACRHDLVVVSDEIHADLILAPQPHIPIASLGADIAARTMTLMSASKAFNIAGLCLAFAHFGSADLRQRFERVPAHGRGGNNAFSLAAVRAAWGGAQPWLDEVLNYLRGNRDQVAAFWRTHWPAVGHLPPQATYLAWLDLRALELPGGPHEFFLQRAQVALGDGRAFGAPGVGFVRLNFATSRALLEQVLERMHAALRAR